MAKQTFTAGQVLTATQMNNLQANDYNWTTSAQTSSYVLVAANAGQTVTMTSASATTITVNTGLFAAGDRINILNLGAGACTITAGTATVNTAGSLVLPQYGSGTLWFSSASAAIFIPDDRTAGLQYVTGTSFTTATSVSLPTSSFTSTYRNYRLLFTITALTSNANFSARLRASGTDNTTSNYFTTLYGTNSAGSSAANASGSQSSWSFQSLVTTSPAYSFAIDIMSPQVAERTMLIGGFNSHDGTNSFSRTGTWLFNATTQFDSFTFISDVASSISGSYRLYGYSEN